MKVVPHRGAEEFLLVQNDKEQTTNLPTLFPSDTILREHLFLQGHIFLEQEYQYHYEEEISENFSERQCGN